MVRQKDGPREKAEQAKQEFRSFINNPPKPPLELGALLKKTINSKYFPALLPIGLAFAVAIWNELFDSKLEGGNKATNVQEEAQAFDEYVQQAQAPQEQGANEPVGLSPNEGIPEQQTAVNQAPDSLELSRSNPPLVTASKVCQFESDQGPEMQVIGGGAFMMGAEKGEQTYANEGPQHVVTVQPFAMSRCEVSVAEYALFVEETGYVTTAEKGRGCYGRNPSNGRWEDFGSWREPGFSQSDASPVVCVNKEDVLQYIQWLSERLGAEYRLPSESEWEYAARVGREENFSFPVEEICRFANVAAEASCPDSFDYSAPVGSFRPNAYGLYDMHGNVFEWVADCWHNDYSAAPNDGSPWGEENGGDCQQGTIRGGAWHLQRAESGATNRGWCQSDSCSFVGFRLAKTL